MERFKKKLLLSLFLVVCLLMVPLSVIAEEYVIRYAGTAAVSMENPEYLAMLKFKEIVEEKTDKIKVELYPANQLGATKEFTEGVSLGTVEMAETGYSLIGLMDRICYVFSMPYLYKSLDHFISVVEGPIGEEINQHVIKTTGIRVLGVLNRGPRHVMNGVRPIYGLEDFKGLKIRCPEIPVWVDTFSALGAIPVPMTWSEVYTSLSQGVIDGVENSMDELYTNNLYEVQKYLSLTSHFFVGVPIIINEKFYSNLPEKYKKIVSDAAKESVLYRRELLKNSEEKSLAEMKKAGIQVVTNPDFEAFAEVTKVVRESYVDGEIITWDIINRIEEYSK